MPHAGDMPMLADGLMLDICRSSLNLAHLMPNLDGFKKSKIEEETVPR